MAPPDRRSMTMIAVGGAAGATVRWAVVSSVGSTAFPWPVLTVNVLGSLVLGMALARPPLPTKRSVRRDAVGAGFCGGLTTFSTFAVEIVELARDHRTAIAALYAVVSVASAVAAAFAGSRVARLRPRPAPSGGLA